MKTANTFKTSPVRTESQSFSITVYGMGDKEIIRYMDRAEMLRVKGMLDRNGESYEIWVCDEDGYMNEWKG